jgi:RNA polymerase primary sigma factor
MKQLNKDKTSAISAYLDSLKQFPLLKHDDMIELFKKYEAGGTGGTIAKNKLIECNLRLVIAIAKQYKDNSIPFEDLVQEGNIGLMKAVERFDWKRGCKFSTYATWWIRQSIGQHVLKRKRIIRLPAHAAAVQRKMAQVASAFKEEVGYDPTNEELIDLVGASKTVVNATIFGGKSVVSLHQPLNSSEDADSLEDRVEDESSSSNPFENVCEKQMLELVKRVLNKLSAKEAAILRLRFGLVEDTVEDCDLYKITDEEITQIMSGKGLT